MNPFDPVPSSWQSASSVVGPNTHAPLPFNALRTVNTGTSGGPVTVRVARIVSPPYDAMIVTGDGSATLEVSMEKPACVAPAAIVTADGTFATALLLLDNEILAPPAGAPAASETVPSGRACPGTDAGVMDSPVNVAEVAAGVVGLDSADATTAVGAAGDESSPHAIDDAAE